MVIRTLPQTNCQTRLTRLGSHLGHRSRTGGMTPVGCVSHQTGTYKQTAPPPDTRSDEGAAKLMRVLDSHHNHSSSQGAAVPLTAVLMPSGEVVQTRTLTSLAGFKLLPSIKTD